MSQLSSGWLLIFDFRQEMISQSRAVIVNPTPGSKRAVKRSLCIFNSFPEYSYKDFQNLVITRSATTVAWLCTY